MKKIDSECQRITSILVANSAQVFILATCNNNNNNNNVNSSSNNNNNTENSNRYAAMVTGIVTET